MNDFIMFPIPASMFTAVCALLGGASTGAIAAANTPVVRPTPNADASPATDPVSAPSGNTGASAPDGNGSTAPIDASPSSSDIDTGGHPWSPELHASTKTKTKEGYWRMKVGVSRPADLPGFPKEGGTGTSSTGSAPEATSSAANADANGAASPSTTATDEDDEFAAFRTALDKDNAAPAETPARKWTDADLGALCNQAAVKLGDPAPVKALIADYVPTGTVPHSRNIPDDKRADFAAAVEAKAGIAFGA
jgi:hypothetical protein